MAHPTAILVSFDPDDPKWELPLGAREGIRSFLVAWRTDPPPVDAGVPEQVAEILARALVSQALVTYPIGTGRQLEFVHTSRAEEAQRAFTSDYFDWTRSAQVIFLSPLAEPPPRVAPEDLLLARLDAGPHHLASAGFLGMVLPGVDGDVAGVYAFSDEIFRALFGAVRTACEEAGVLFMELTQDQLTEVLAED